LLNTTGGHPLAALHPRPLLPPHHLLPGKVARLNPCRRNPQKREEKKTLNKGAPVGLILLHDIGEHGEIKETTRRALTIGRTLTSAALSGSSVPIVKEQSG